MLPRTAKSQALRQIMQQHMSVREAVIDQEDSDQDENVSDIPDDELQIVVSGDNENGVDIESSSNESTSLSTDDLPEGQITSHSGELWSSNVPRIGQRIGRNILRLCPGSIPHVAARLHYF